MGFLGLEQEKQTSPGGKFGRKLTKLQGKGDYQVQEKISFERCAQGARDQVTQVFGGRRSKTPAYVSFSILEKGEEKKVSRKSPKIGERTKPKLPREEKFQQEGEDFQAKKIHLGTGGVKRKPNLVGSLKSGRSPTKKRGGGEKQDGGGGEIHKEFKDCVSSNKNQKEVGKGRNS